MHTVQAPEVKIKRKRAHERREDDLETNTLLIQMGAKLTPDMSLEDGAVAPPLCCMYALMARYVRVYICACACVCMCVSCA